MAAPTFNAHQLSASEERGAIFESYIAGEDVVIGNAVYLSANQVFKGGKTTLANSNGIGLVVIADNFYGETTVKQGGTAQVVVHGPVWGFTGLTGGTKYYMDTAGALTDTAPTGGAYQYSIGYALDAETLFIDPGTSTPLSHA